MGIRSIFRKSSTVLFAAVFLLSQYPQSLLAAPDEEQAKTISVVFSAVDEMEDLVDRSTFDVSALARALAFDPQRMFAYVQSEILFQPYVGVLRGARGTLAAGSGNALDQSQLLAALLQQAGYQIRFATGTLPDDKVAAVLEEFAATPMTPPAEPWSEAQWADAVASLEAVNPDLTKLLAMREEALDEASVAFWDRVAWHDAMLQAASPVEQTGAILDLAAEARDHVWVRYLDESGVWIDLDPTVPETRFGATAAQAEQEYESLPEDFLHRLEIIATIYVASPDGTVTERVVLEDVLTIAETTGESIAYRNVPDVDDAPGANMLSEWLGGIDSFTATLSVGNETHLGMGFNLAGDVYEPSGDAVDALRGATEEGFGGLGSGLDSLFAPEDDAEPQGDDRLVGHTLTFTLIMPRNGGEPEVVAYDRALVSPYEIEHWDPDSPTLSIADHEAVPMVADLLQRFEMTPVSGRLSLAQFATFEFEALRENRVLLEALTDALDKQDELAFEDSRGSVRGAGSLATLGLVTEWQILLAQFMSQRHPAAALYRAEPALVGYVTGIGVEGEDLSLHQSYDIIHSRPRAVDRATGASLPAVKRFAGVVETVLEEEMLRPLFDVPLTKPVGTPAVFEAAAQELIATVVLRPEGSNDALSKLMVPENVKADIAADLERGYAVIVPSTPSPLDSDTTVAWWRTNTANGATLGILPGGGGAAGTEDLFTRIMNNIFSKEGFLTIADIFIGVAAGAACVAGSSVVDPEHSQAAQTADLFACIAVGVLVGYGINSPASHARRLAIAGVIIAAVVAGTS